jgi:hypothetical protein
MNEAYPNSCQGAFSLSPGDYLTLKYLDVAQKLGAESTPKPVWCLFAKNDPESAVVCQSLSDIENATLYEYEGYWHGLQLVVPDLTHNTLELMLDFLTNI